MAGRIATVRLDVRPGGGGDLRRRLSRVLLAGSPRIMLAGPTLGRLDARGWGRRGGGEALGRALLEAARREGLAGASVGIADVAVAADAAARVAAAGSAGDDDGEGEADVGGEGTGEARRPIRVVPADGARAFLAPLPLDVLPLSGELRETLRALGLSRAGELARLGRREVEARLGPEGVRARRWARGEDARPLPFDTPGGSPSASLGMDAPVRSVEPLLFGLRQLLHRLCRDLAGEGRCAARLTVELTPERGEGREVEVAPARPTRREDLLFDLCRAAVERAAGGDALPAPVEGLSLRVDERAPAEARQGDLFGARGRDPLEAAAALSRLRARLGPDAVVWPASGRGRRPETRGAWVPVDPEGEPPADGSGGREEESVGAAGGRPPGRPGGETAEAEGHGPPLSGALRLLPEPEPVEVSVRDGRPAGLRGPRGRHRVEAAEGPERISGAWWDGPYAREYWWVVTGGRELLWVFRERLPGGGSRWRLHGWWD